MIPADDFRAVAIKVLIINNDEDVGAELVINLDRSGMRTSWARTGAAGMALKHSFHPDIILIDLNLRDVGRYELVKTFAAAGDCGVIISPGTDDETDRIVGLEMGADDYVTEPSHSRELRARIRAVHRRMTTRSVVKTNPIHTVFQLGKFRVDIAGREVRSNDGQRIGLTGSEFVALEVMIAANGEAVSRDRLSETALRRPWRAEDRSVDQLIFNLRHKLSRESSNPLIHSVRGAGYLLTIGLPSENQDKASHKPLALGAELVG